MKMREVALLHAETNEFKMRLSDTETFIDEVLALGYPAYVALSGGKDSTVVFDLIHRRDQRIPAIFVDDEFWLPETDQYLNRLRENPEIDLRQVRDTVRHAEWFKVEGEWHGIHQYAHAHGLELSFMGLRQEESAQRRMTLRKNGRLYHVKGRNSWHCHPIGNWIWRDVWAYIFSREVVYNRAYDKLWEMNLPPSKQRIGPYAVSRVLEFGQIAILKKGWPEEFNRFAAAHPEATRYV